MQNVIPDTRNDWQMVIMRVEKLAISCVIGEQKYNVRLSLPANYSITPRKGNNMEDDDLKNCEYILWKYYGYEGWTPFPVKDKKQLLEEIAQTYGSRYVVTQKILDIKVMIN